MCVLIRKYYRSPVRLFIFGKMSYAVRLLDPVWKLGTSEQVGGSIRVFKPFPERKKCFKPILKKLGLSNEVSCVSTLSLILEKFNRNRTKPH